MRVVLLEHPRKPSTLHYNDISNTPLWSCLMSGYAGACLLGAGFDATIVDASRWSFEKTCERLLRMPIDLLAVHAVYFWERTECLMQMLANLKQEGFRAPVCLFGFFPTLVWREILATVPAVDYVLVGEPEESIVELARSLENGRGPCFPGLAARTGGKAALFGVRPPVALLDLLPHPLRPDFGQQETMSILASRGCYNRCDFCLVPTLNDGRGRWRPRSSENVAAEIASLVERAKSDFYFVDPNFVGPGKAGKDHALKLARNLAKLDITFGMETRAADIDSPLIESLTAVGLKSLLLGIESGSSSVLKRLGKNTNAAQNERAIARVRAAGIEPEIGFIMFEPQSTLEEIGENFQFLQRNHLLDRLSRTANLLYHCQVVFKGTPGYERALARAKLIPQGLFGFEGRLIYEDGRVAWLSDLTKAICHYVLKEMERKASKIHWCSENDGTTAFKRVNACLVELFQELLSMAEDLKTEPGREVMEKTLAESIEKIENEMGERHHRECSQGDRSAERESAFFRGKEDECRRP